MKTFESEVPAIFLFTQDRSCAPASPCARVFQFGKKTAFYDKLPSVQKYSVKKNPYSTSRTHQLSSK